MNSGKSYIAFTVYQSRNKFRYTLTRKPQGSQRSTNISIKLAQRILLRFYGIHLFYKIANLFHANNNEYAFNFISIIIAVI